MSARPRRDTALFNLPPRPKGRVEVALDKALTAARAAGGLTDVDLAVLTLARAQARGVDCAEADRNTWALAAIGRELRETLIRMRMDPVSRGSSKDELIEFLRSLAQPDHPGAEVGDPAQP